MNTFLEKAQKTAKSVVYKLSVHTNSAWSKAMLNKEIIELRADMSKGFKTLSHRYYEMWAKENIDFDEIDGICQEILDKEDKINGIRRVIRELTITEQSRIEEWNLRNDKPILTGIADSDTDVNSSMDIIAGTGSSDPETEVAPPIKDVENEL